RREFARASEILDQAERLAEKDQLASMTAVLLATRAELHLAQGRPVQAIELAKRVGDLAEASVQTRAMAQLILAEALVAAKRPAPSIRAAFERASTAMRERPPRLRARVHESYSRYLRDRGRIADALAESEKALRLLQPIVR